MTSVALPAPPTEAESAVGVRWSATALTAIVAVFLVVGWVGIRGLDPVLGWDGDAFIHYAAFLEKTGRLPPESETYEYATPPAYFLAAISVQRIATAVASERAAPLQSLRAPVARVLWILSCVAACWLLAFGGGRIRRALGITLAAAILIAALAEAVVLAGNNAWKGGQLLSLLWGAAVVVLAWFIAREAWPGRPSLWAVVALACAAMPPLIRMSVMFHPETQAAALCLGAILAMLVSRRRRWPFGGAAAAGALLGMAAMTRQSALAVVAALVLAVLLLAGRPGRAFIATLLCATVLVAGPWWIAQGVRTGNPIKSNLSRPGKMLDHQPLSFYLSFPLRSLVLHPYREDFRNQLLPRMHAEIWSDWGGGIHGYWIQPTRAARLDASTQSVLGLVADVLCLAGIAVFGSRGLGRVRRGAGTAFDATVGTALVVCAVTWAAFLVNVIRFPQFDGDPIKSTYMLWLVPLFALGGVAAGDALWRRSRVAPVLLCGWACLYAVSFTVHLLTAFGGL